MLDSGLIDQEMFESITGKKLYLKDRSKKHPILVKPRCAFEWGTIRIFSLNHLYRYVLISLQRLQDVETKG